MPLDESLFETAHQALMFAFTFGDNDHSTAGAAERQVALQARDRYERTASSGRNLRGLDGAAQAGLIRSRIERSTSPLQQAALIARFAIRSDAERWAACALIALRVRSSLPPTVSIRTLTRLVGRALGREVNLHHIAQAQAVDERTVRRWARTVRTEVETIERGAMLLADTALIRANVVRAKSDG